MLTIKNKQFGILEKSLRQQFITMTALNIRNYHEDEYVKSTTEEWHNWIEQKMQECISYEILEEKDFKQYVEISLNYPLMEKRPLQLWIEELLGNNSRDVEERFSLLIEKLEFTTND